jgi:hypothetical protein
MALQMLKRIGIRQAYLAGFDGYAPNASYFSYDLENYLSQDVMDKLNLTMFENLKKLGKSIKLSFITKSGYSL